MVKVRRVEPHRLTRALFGDFTIVLVALRQARLPRPHAKSLENFSV